MCSERGSSKTWVFMQALQTRRISWAMLLLCLMEKDKRYDSFKTSLSPSSCHQLVPQVPWSRELGASVFNTFSFPPQHRFLPCENKSKAVEQVKSAFNKVSLDGGKEGLGTTASAHSPRGRSRQVLSRPHPLLGGTVGTQQMV